jgi:hypothetical protein
MGISRYIRVSALTYKDCLADPFPSARSALASMAMFAYRNRQRQYFIY